MRWKEPSFAFGDLAEFLVLVNFKQDVFRNVGLHYYFGNPFHIIQLTVVLAVDLISQFPKSKHTLDFVHAVASGLLNQMNLQSILRSA